MFRFTLNVFAMVFLAGAVLLAIADASRSIAADGWVLTPLAKSWSDTLPTSLEAIEKMLGAPLWGVIAPVLSLPGFAVLGALALLFYVMAGRSRRSRGFAGE